MSGLNILVANGDLAAPDRDSGSLRLFRILEILVADGHRVTFVARAGFGQEQAAARLAALGIEVFPVDRDRLRALGAPIDGVGIDFSRLLSDRGFDLALLSFYDVAEQYLPLIRSLSPLTRVAIDTVDVHHVRERRGAQLSGDAQALAAAERTRLREQAIYGAADALVAVSDDDAAALRELAPEVPVSVVSNVHAPAPPTPGFESRDGLVFVGSFPHVPNVDAVLGFHRDTWPLVRAGLPDARLTLVGTKPPLEVRNLRGPRLEVTGWVPEVAPYLDGARVSIAPLRYGAGVKGKIGEALSRGLPVVTTPVGAEGMDLRDGEHALVADSPPDFAAAVGRLHSDRGLWDTISTAGRAHIEARLGVEAARGAVRRLLDEVIRTPFVMPAGAGEDEVAAAIGSYATTFSPSDPASLVLTVAAEDPDAAQAALVTAAGTLDRAGLDPETVADIQIAPIGAHPVLPARAVIVGPAASGPAPLRHVAADSPAQRWRELAAFASTARARRPSPRAAILIHAVDDAGALSAQLGALREAGLPSDVELVLAADGAGAQTEALLASLGDVKVIRGTSALGRHDAWQLAAHATTAPFVVTLAPLAMPAPGFLEALLAPLYDGATIAGPVVGGAAGLRLGPDGSLWPRRDAQDGALDALALDCLATPRELIAEGLPPLARGEGLIEAQLGAWAAARFGGVALAPDAHVQRLAAPAASVIVCTRDRAEELSDGIELLVLGGARDVVIVDNGSTDETPAVAAELARRHPGVVRVVHEPRGGLCHARNAGAAAARTDLLLYVDDDARPGPGWLEHLAWALARPGVVNAGGPISALWPSQRPAGWPGRDLEALLSVLDLGDVERSLVAPDVVYGANWAVRREALRAVGGFDPQFGPGPEARINGDEVSVAWRLAQRGLGATIYAPGAAVGHRISADRVDDRFMLHRALCVGVEKPRHAQALGQAGPSQLLSGAQAAAGRLFAAHPLDGDLSVSEALESISCAPAPLAQQVPVAMSLGELAASVALLGETEVLLGDARLRIDADSVLRGVVAAPAGAPA